MASGPAPPPETAIHESKTDWTPRPNKDSAQNACGCRVATRHPNPAERAVSYACEVWAYNTVFHGHGNLCFCIDISLVFKGSFGLESLNADARKSPLTFLLIHEYMGH